MLGTVRNVRMSSKVAITQISKVPDSLRSDVVAPASIASSIIAANSMPERSAPTTLGSGALDQIRNFNDRRFPRVYLHTQQAPLAKVLGARGGWAGNSELSVCDLSHTGVAFLRSAMAHGPLSFRERERLEITLHLAGERVPVKAQATLVRANDSVVAFDFRPLTSSTRLAIEKFLQSKLVGLHLRPVGRDHYRTTETLEGLTHWFQGPANANVLLWYSELTLKKAVIEIGDDWLQWTSGQGKGSIQERLNPLTLKELGGGDVLTLRGLSPFVSRVVDILAHVPDEEKVLIPLIRALTTV